MVAVAQRAIRATPGAAKFTCTTMAMNVDMTTQPLHAAADVAALAQRGVVLPRPELVSIGAEVPLDAIAAGAVLHPGCRLYGAETRVDEGAELGTGGAVTLHDAWVGTRAAIGTLGPVTLVRTAAGPGTVLGCGVAEDAVFLGKEVADPAFTTGFGFRVRKGSLYEEDANSAQHTDTKMTVLLPWVTLGSNINWCDILVAGGMGPGLGEFSEVGSGAVHFNFTPRGDKATGSCLGDVCSGVFLDQPRLFIGGNGSIIGPCTAAFGAVTGAGERYGGDLRPGLNLPLPHPDEEAAAGFDLSYYGAVKRVVLRQLHLVGQLSALDAWYAGVRAHLAAGDAARQALYARGRAMVGWNLAERIKQLDALVARVDDSVQLLYTHLPGDVRIPQQWALVNAWNDIRPHLEQHAEQQQAPPQALLDGLDTAAAAHGPAYTAIIRGLSPEARAAGHAWLQGIAERVAAPTLLQSVPDLPRRG